MRLPLGPPPAKVNPAPVLAHAVICLDCDGVRDVSVLACPRCASRTAWLLAKWLTR